MISSLASRPLVRIIPHICVLSLPGVTSDVLPDSWTGFKSGDIVVKVDGVTLSADEKETSQLVQKIKSSGGKVPTCDTAFSLLSSDRGMPLISMPHRLEATK
jgi:hypothetical protein